MAYQDSKKILDGLAFASGAECNFGNAESLLRVQIKTANYTVTAADTGTWFTTSGDTGAITFTLPTTPRRGLHYFFFQSTNQNMTINSAAADGIVTFNDLDADGVIASTSSEKTGALFVVFADGVIWNAACISNGTTLTVTT